MRETDREIVCKFTVECCLSHVWGLWEQQSRDQGHYCMPCNVWQSVTQDIIVTGYYDTFAHHWCAHTVMPHQILCKTTQTHTDFFTVVVPWTDNATQPMLWRCWADLQVEYSWSFWDLQRTLTVNQQGSSLHCFVVCVSEWRERKRMKGKEAGR